MGLVRRRHRRGALDAFALIVATRSLVLVVPGDIETRTGGYVYDRRIVAGLRDRGWTVTVETLDTSFPQPTLHARVHAAQLLAAIPGGQLVMVDGLAMGAMPAEVERERERLKLVALVHHPLALETGIDAADARSLEISEREALAAVRLVVVTSRRTASALGPYRVPEDRIAIVEPGTDAAPLARGSRSGVLRLLCVASIIPRKGHKTLIDALMTMKDRAWHLTCVGGLRDQATFEQVRERIQTAGLVDRVTFTSDLDQPALAVEYDHADVFVLPTLYEGYGMAVAEALARGLPVVSTATGAIGELVGNEAGILVPPADVESLARALAGIMDEPAARDRLREGACRVRARLPTWTDAAKSMEAALERANDTGAHATHFSTEWLTLREPADERARSRTVALAVAEALPAGRPLEILDLGAGTGSNARFLSAYLRSPQRWLLVDRDPSLLAVARSRADVPTAARTIDLSTLADHRELFVGRDLVTASALLDLVSDRWLREMLTFCRDVGTPVLFALTYDGRMACSPREPEDDSIRELVNAHQRSDKGLGTAMGPDAPDRTAAILLELGYEVVRDVSDWQLGEAFTELQSQLIDGWAEAATAVAPQQADDIARWRHKRIAHVREGRSHIRVGHEDIAGLPTRIA